MKRIIILAAFAVAAFAVRELARPVELRELPVDPAIARDCGNGDTRIALAHLTNRVEADFLNLNKRIIALEERHAALPGEG